jgi:hypothetical protein
MSLPDPIHTSEQRMRYYTKDWKSGLKIPYYVKPLLKKLGHGDEDISRIKGEDPVEK